MRSVGAAQALCWPTSLYNDDHLHNTQYYTQYYVSVCRCCRQRIAANLQVVSCPEVEVAHLKSIFFEVNKTKKNFSENSFIF